jgi:hypothetical protein
VPSRQTGLRKFARGLNIACRRSDGSPVTTPAVAQRAACPACGAATRLGDPWCTLCYADLTPAAETPADDAPASVDAAVPASVIAPPPAAAAQVDLLAQLATGSTENAAADTDSAGNPVEGPADGEDGGSPLDSVTMPCPACETQVRLLVSNCPVCGTDMLAPLRGPDLSDRNQFMRELLSMSRGARMAMAGVIAVLLLVTIFSVTSIMG